VFRVGVLCFGNLFTGIRYFDHAFLEEERNDGKVAGAAEGAFAVIVPGIIVGLLHQLEACFYSVGCCHSLQEP